MGDLSETISTIKFHFLQCIDWLSLKLAHIFRKYMVTNADTLLGIQRSIATSLLDKFNLEDRWRSWLFKRKFTPRYFKELKTLVHTVDIDICWWHNKISRAKSQRMLLNYKYLNWISQCNLRWRNVRFIKGKYSIPKLMNEGSPLYFSVKQHFLLTFNTFQISHG